MKEMSWNYLNVCPAGAGNQCGRCVGVLVIFQNSVVLHRICMSRFVFVIHRSLIQFVDLKSK